jgi:O-antigen ligase
VGYILAANLMRTRRDVGIMALVFLLANGLYALEGAFRYVFLIRTDVLDVAQEFTYGHEVVIFLAVVLLQAMVQIVVGGPLWRRLLGLSIAPIALFTLFATQRRAGYIAMAIAFVLISIPWLVRHRKAFLLIFVPGMVAAAIYLPLFWNNTGFLGQPARAVRSLTAPDARDASSNEYRDQEAINVRETIRSDPLLGVGFGRPFLFVVPLADLSWWPFWHYQPHHNVLWVWLKVGAPGFTIFFMLMLGALALASSRALTLRDPTLIGFAYIAIASVVTTLVFCYVDLGLTNGRVTVFLGAILGVLAVLRHVDDEDAAPAEKPVEAGKGRAGARDRASAARSGARPTTRPSASPRGRWTPGPVTGPVWATPPGPTPGPASAPPPEPAPTPAGAGRA